MINSSDVYRVSANHDYSNLNVLDWDVDLLADGGLVHRLNARRLTFSIYSPDLDIPDVWYPDSQVIALVVLPALADRICALPGGAVSVFSLDHHKDPEIRARVAVVPLTTISIGDQEEAGEFRTLDDFLEQSWTRNLPGEREFPVGLFQIPEFVSLYVGTIAGEPSLTSLVEISNMTGIRFDLCKRV